MFELSPKIFYKTSDLHDINLLDQCWLKEFFSVKKPSKLFLAGRTFFQFSKVFFVVVHY